MPARKKKNGVPMMRAVIATCSLLGILAVIYYGGRDVSSNTAGLGGISAALLLGQNQAASVYDPGHDWCFTDHDNPGKLCWYPIHRYPIGNWGGWDAAYGQCGDLCTDVYTPGQKDGDGPCLPATNTFGRVSQGQWVRFTKHNPFQTCYQYGDEDKYC